MKYFTIKKLLSYSVFVEQTRFHINVVMKSIFPYSSTLGSLLNLLLLRYWRKSFQIEIRIARSNQLK